MNENIYKFIKKKKIKKNIEKCDMSTEILVKEIDVKKYKIDFINMIKEDIIKGNVIKKDIIKDNIIKENIIKDNIIKENVIKDNMIKDNIIKENVIEKDMIKKDIIKENFIKKDIIKENFIKKDMIKDNIIKENIIKDNIIKKDMIKDNIIKKDMIKDNKNSLSLRDRVLNFKNINKSEIRCTSLDKHLNLPKKYLNLTRIFRVMLTIQKYNINRGLSNIFSKCKKCIEDVLKFRVSINDVEKIRYLIKEDIIIKEVEVDDMKTFTYLLKCTVEDFDMKVWEYYQNNKDKDNIFDESYIIKEDIKTNLVKEDIKNNLVKEDIKTNLVKEDIKTNLVKEDIKTNLVKEDIKKYSNILDRIKERERLRKEEFIKKSKEEDNSVFLKKIDMYFKKENKTCIKINEIIKVFNLYDGERYLRKLSVKERVFDIIEISGEEYLIIKK